MKTTVAASPVAVQRASSVHAETTRKQIRGSSLLLAGRGFSLVINLITQIVVIRYLSRLDYGAFAWSFSVIEMTALMAAFGMDKSLSRFGAIYHERGDFRRLCGILILSGSVLLITGAIVVAAVWSYSVELTSLFSVDPIAVSLLVTLIVLVPANIFSSVSLSIYTVFGKTHTVFVRRHLLGPSIRLGMVLIAILFQGGLQYIAMAYLVSGLVAAFIDASLVARYLREENIPQKMKQERPIIPLREFFSYSLPLLTSDVAFLVRGTLIVFMLGWLATTTASASFRAVLPIVRLNELILINFTLLFMPLASRLFSQADEEQLGEMYQRTSVWAMVLSFPIFAVSITLAPSITVLMFGEEYADASTILIILSVGYYVQSMLGFNSQLMKVLGMARTFMALDVLATLLALTMCWFLIPDYGAQGAAIGVSSAIIMHALSKYLAIRFLTNYAHQATDFNKSFLMTGSCALVLILTQACFDFHWSIGVLLAASTIYLVFSCNRHLLNITSFFPELNKIPLLGSWLSVPIKTNSVAQSCDKTVSSNKLKIGYIMSRFPKITETFVLFEMREMERQGHQVELFPLQRERTSVIHNEAETYVNRAFFTPWLSFQIILAHLCYLRKSPVVYFKTVWTLVKANWGSARYLSGAILFFPKVVYLARLMQKRNIDHLHVHFASHPAMAAWVIHQFTGIPYSFTAHGSDLHRDQHMLQEKVADADAVITISNYNRQMILDICGQQQASRVHVVHCGIDPQDFKSKEIPTPFDTGNGPFRFACVGTLHEVKGQRFLLEACSQLKEKEIDFQCHLVGDGPDQQMLKELVLRAGLDKHVQFEGRLTSTEIQELLKRLDLLVAPSVPTKCGRREGIPVVLMEALGSGLSVIASDLSGIPEIVIDGQTGLLTPPGDSNAIAEALTRMYYDQPLRHRLAKAGQEKVMQEFNLPINVQSLVNLLRQGK
ncbi:Glycosyl transferase, group 1 family protein [hydrothermal vent metagenome]|uniref:Glycosyl transferase, group 1 family protein n=1 Tax=hydrothermal vent metagenome TaxID=652676 RepID=A0A3B1E0C0_9ZZZZ